MIRITFLVVTCFLLTDIAASQITRPTNTPSERHTGFHRPSAMTPKAIPRGSTYPTSERPTEHHRPSEIPTKIIPRLSTTLASERPTRHHRPSAIPRGSTYPPSERPTEHHRPSEITTKIIPRPSTYPPSERPTEHHRPSGPSTTHASERPSTGHTLIPTKAMTTLFTSPRSDNKIDTNQTVVTTTARSNTSRPDEGSVRLVGGSVYYEGRVEMYKEGQWGSVCDHSFDTDDATVVCRQLGFQNGGNSVFPSTMFGQSNGTIAMQNPDCYGYETRLEECGTRGWYECHHDLDIAVICSTYEPPPPPSYDSYNYFLMSTDTEPYQGVVVVSVNYGEQWGIICDIDDMAARAICSSLGYGTENAESMYFYTDPFKYPEILDGLFCPSYYDVDENYYNIDHCTVRPTVNGTCSYDYGNKGVRCNPLGYWHGIPHHIVMAVSIAFSVAIFLIVVLAITACCCGCCCRKTKTKVVTTVPAPKPAPKPEPTKVGVYIPIHPIHETETKVPLDQTDSEYA